MEAISYVNIFETKGLEYLLVISFLLGFVLLVRYVAATDEAVVRLKAAEPSTFGASRPVACTADFGCPYRTCLTEILDDEDEPHQEDVVA